MKLPIQAAPINRQVSPIQMLVGQAGETGGVNIEPSGIPGHCYIHHNCPDDGDRGEMTKRQCQDRGGYSWMNFRGGCENLRR